MKRARSVLLLATLAGCATAVNPPAAPNPPRAPVVTAGPDLGKRAEAEHGMVASAHPLASQAGLEMLRAGGNAVDAAVAAAFAIGVVEPMMAGIGGSGGGMMIWTQSDARADYLDFYSVAPAAITSDFDRRVAPERIVAVPGSVAGLLEAHERMGTLPRERILAPAIALAAEGFPVGSLLARTIADDSAKLAHSPGARRIFWPGGRPLQPGEVLRQPELAETLRAIAARGRDGFHRGPVAEEVVRVLNAGGNPITVRDMADFAPRWRRPICTPYRDWQVLAAPPPQSGMQIAQTLKLLEPYDLAKMGLPSHSPDAFHLIAGAIRISTSDRRGHLSDPADTGVPARGISSAAYAAERGRLLVGEAVPERVRPGDPWEADASPARAACATREPYGSSPVGRIAFSGESEPGEAEGGETTHLSVVDAEGNAVALTYTQGVYFGSGVWAAGTFLNSAMNIFSSNPESPNVLRPLRSPTSTISPTIVLEDDRVRMVVGSPGAGRIPPAVVQTIVYVLDYGLDPMEALRMPRIQAYDTSRRVEYEQGIRADVLREARARGYLPEVMPPASLYFGGVHVIDRQGDRWVGAADPRRDGEVRGY